jgi:hypothetical protein
MSKDVEGGLAQFSRFRWALQQLALQRPDADQGGRLFFSTLPGITSVGATHRCGSCPHLSKSTKGEAASAGRQPGAPFNRVLCD